jgi:hypothetical protein
MGWLAGAAAGFAMHPLLALPVAAVELCLIWRDLYNSDGKTLARYIFNSKK